MSFARKVKRWCKEHERELIICGATTGVIVGTVIINKKLNARHKSTTNKYIGNDIVMNLDDNSVTFLPVESEVAMGANSNYYRQKYPDIPDALVAPAESTLNFVGDNIINRFTDFDGVGYEPDLAVAVLNEATDEILNKVDIDDIKAIQMLIDLK